MGEFSLFTMGRAQYVEAANTMTSCAVCMHYAPCGRLLSSLIRTLSSASLPLGQPFIRQCTTLLQVCDGQCRGLYWPHRTAHCAQRIRWGVLPGAFLVVRCVGSFMPVCVCVHVCQHIVHMFVCVCSVDNTFRLLSCPPRVSFVSPCPARHPLVLHAEVMGTTVLILLVLLVEMQARRFPEGSDMKLMYEVGIQYIVICFIVVVLIAGDADGHAQRSHGLCIHYHPVQQHALCLLVPPPNPPPCPGPHTSHPAGLGGPTAYAANPARDLGPRLAHALLPIPGKGPSEWCYAWVPVLAPLVGGALAGVLYIGIEEMQFPEGGSRGGGLFVG